MKLRAMPPLPSDNDLPSRLLLLRLERGWTQEDAARSVHVTKAAWGNWEQGKMPSLAMLQRIKKEFAVTLDWLIDGDRSTLSRQAYDRLLPRHDAG